ncbi:3-deoxy-D-manno-octulosonic acid transferase [Yeosuana sp.]|uniref:3-deoxy-D-manno-octulosonic acid transferase n=1 Tax=Yeosuana sp. TaxID=2529388 RepID=UPI00405521DF
MEFLYNIAITITRFILQCTAVLNLKIRKGVQGRAETFSLLERKLSAIDNTLWFHCASLGEYEQGLPVFKALRNHYKQHKIVLSFFSPSGYEIRKNSPIADVVVYLPMDSKANAKQFLNLVHPDLTVFVKYDIWPNFLNELKSSQLRAILISAVFRKNQPFFKFYGNHLRHALFSFEHIFTQNESSKKLLESINYNHVTVSGDTRFDRVTSQLEQNNTLDFIAEFKLDNLCVVAGSTWPEDESLFINYINSESSKGIKFIIAPHNINLKQISNFQSKLEIESVLFSRKEEKDISKTQVLVIDTIGLLSKIYSYADIAYVGGAMGHTGLHNTLEPAVFGIPIIIGDNHSKFPEAQEMIDNAGMFSVSNQKEFENIMNELIQNNQKRLLSGKNNFKYIEMNAGAVNHILKYLNLLKQ